MLVSICLCTYKRQHLRDTLNSLRGLTLPEGCSVEVVVVDNDIELSGKPIIDELTLSYPYTIRYISEPQKNISIARNQLLANAKGELITFIDDDEVVSTDWFFQLKKAADKFEADVVFGRVISTFPEGTPSWIIKGGFFDRARKNTGTQVSSGACNCTFVKSSIIQELRFDECYGLSGGEDADFFHRLHKKGAKLIYCDEAIVSEEVEVQRLNISYLMTRRLRIGSTFSKYRYENSNILRKLPYIAKSFALLSLYTLLTLFSSIFGKELCYKNLLKACDHFGKIRYFFSRDLKAMY